MTTKVKPIPDGYHAVTPYLAINGAANAIEFYKKAFGANERMRMPGPNGKVMHAEIKIGDSVVMLADEFPDMGFRGPQPGSTSVSLMIYVEDVDKVTAQATAVGAKVLRPIQDQFYGDRTSTLTDPFGHVWTVATHKEDVSSEELKRRAEAMFKSGQGGCSEKS